jgi:hypothetical protein
LGGLGIETHFAKIRNAQAKIIERTFGKVNTMFSRFLFGYRGPNVVQRPEELRDQIRRGEIMTYEEWTVLFEKFIREVLNREECDGKVHLGRSADEVWDSEYPQAVETGAVRRVSDDALSLFCRKVSGDFKIKGNGIWDNALNAWYWGDWMVAHIGRPVYMRRSRNDVSESAYVFDCETEQLLGIASYRTTVASLAKTDEQRETLRDALATQARVKKDLERTYKRPTHSIDIVSARAKAAQVLAEARGYVPSETKPEPAAITLTAADVALAQHRAQESVGTADLSVLVDPKRKRESVDPWEYFAASAG